MAARSLAAGPQRPGALRRTLRALGLALLAALALVALAWLVAVFALLLVAALG